MDARSGIKAQVTQDEELFEERAAILQYDGKMSREKAEQKAKEQLWQLRRDQNQAPLFAR